MSKIRDEKSPVLPLRLRNDRLRLSHGHKSFRDGFEVDHQREESIHPSLDIRFRHCYYRLRSDPDELPEQSTQYIFPIHVSIIQGNAESQLISLFISVSPVYYVTFTVSVLTASFILFQGFNTTSSINTISLLCGFLIIFSGVYLLNLADKDPDGHTLLHGRIESGGIPTDGIAGLQTRLSMQSQRRSQDPRRGSQGSINFSSPATPRDRLMHSFDVENGSFALSDLPEEDDSEDNMDEPDKPLQGIDKAPMNGNGKAMMNGDIRR